MMNPRHRGGISERSLWIATNFAEKKNHLKCVIQITLKWSLNSLIKYINNERKREGEKEKERKRKRQMMIKDSLIVVYSERVALYFVKLFSSRAFNLVRKTSGDISRLTNRQKRPRATRSRECYYILLIIYLL